MVIQDEKFLTVRETAGYLQLTEQTVRKWINNGKLNAIKIGKEYRVKLSDLTEILN